MGYRNWWNDGHGYVIAWQRGKIEEEGRNGAFVVDILGVVRERLHYYQRKNGCEENAEALIHVEAAMKALEDRLDRREKEKRLSKNKV